ncbi:DNA repair ATPase [Salinibacterium xinjiangense]|nr:DNA repair ATPase [Salinibacterium xinjiangense]
MIHVATDDQAPWGRVDETGTVFVREATGERAVGQYPDGSPEEALAYFQRKFSELAGQVTLLEQRVKRGAPASDVSKAVRALAASIATANAVGNLAALQSRIEALGGTVTELTVKQTEESKAVVSAALVERESLVVEAETLAAQDPAKAQWKQVTATIDEIFARWQKHQADGPRLPKNEANELWKRFRAARATIDTHRKAFFAELDSVHKDAKAAKQALVEKAEGLVGKGAEGIPIYRNLLDQWKAAGRAGKKFDDALWAQFKEAGDALYSAKGEVDAQDSVEFTANLELKETLLVEAEPLLTETDRSKAKDALLRIQTNWDKIGKVPRDKVKTIEDRLRKVENAVRKLDEDHWQKNNPERKQRESGFLGQLNDAIAKLERELDDAKASGDKRAISTAQEALDARKAWLGAIAK